MNLKLNQQLNEAIRSRDEFISIASHELKTPLTSLTLQVHSLKKNLEREDDSSLNFLKLKKLADQMEKQAYKLNRLIDDLLDISRIRTGKVSLKRELICLEDLVSETCERIAEQFPEKKELIIFKPSNEKVWGIWDHDRLEQVLNNLIVNALKYGNNQPFEISLFQNNNSAMIKVRDHGIGIPKEMLVRVFDKFERADVSTIDMTGLGLGLYISQQIIKAHNGKIWAESFHGEGATFWIELPLSS